MPDLSTVGLMDLLPFIAVGFAAQLVDGALGMAFRVISTSMLLSLGLLPAAASAGVNTVETFTTGVSGASHGMAAVCLGHKAPELRVQGPVRRRAPVRAGSCPDSIEPVLNISFIEGSAFRPKCGAATREATGRGFGRDFRLAHFALVSALVHCRLRE